MAEEERSLWRCVRRLANEGLDFRADLIPSDYPESMWVVTMRKGGPTKQLPLLRVCRGDAAATGATHRCTAQSLGGPVDMRDAVALSFAQGEHAAFVTFTVRTDQAVSPVPEVIFLTAQP